VLDGGRGGALVGTGVELLMTLRAGHFWKLGAIAIILMVLFGIYDAVYPSDSFYEGEFERVSGLSYPRSGVIRHKDSTYPDIHGDYSSCALIEVSADDYQRIRTVLLSAEKHSDATLSSLCGGLSLEEIRIPKITLAIEKEFDEKTGEASGWGVLEGSQLVYFYYWSS
jgi:hypothetical protein